jgi:hypothetical protein
MYEMHAYTYMWDCLRCTPCKVPLFHSAMQPKKDRTNLTFCKIHLWNTLNTLDHDTPIYNITLNVRVCEGCTPMWGARLLIFYVLVLPSLGDAKSLPKSLPRYNPQRLRVPTSPEAWQDLYIVDLYVNTTRSTRPQTW